MADLWRYGYLDQYGEAKRSDIDQLLLDKISDALEAPQKSNWIRNLIQEMRQEGTIRTQGSGKGPGVVWELSKTREEPGD